MLRTQKGNLIWRTTHLCLIQSTDYSELSECRCWKTGLARRTCERLGLSVFLTLSIKIAQKPYIIGSLGPKALRYESLDAKGKMTILRKHGLLDVGCGTLSLTSLRVQLPKQRDWRSQTLSCSTSCKDQLWEQWHAHFQPQIPTLRAETINFASPEP